MSANADQLGEQNRGPRTNKSTNQFIVKAYTTKAGNCNPDGNIVISADEYNKDDFPIDYVNGKFFVIKSYSEDDVHKSIKYNVWSSTPNGNKKLNNAYEEAQKIAAGKPRGCPIFLFFSVSVTFIKIIFISTYVNGFGQWFFKILCQRTLLTKLVDCRSMLVANSVVLQRWSVL